ncbi:glycosyltransferase family 2 protein [Thomasclavelia spiroformis]|uniref:Glycosyltransferase n=1 Tax=Thomasclavelia spiroformis TaxID=29348 RepID=A0A921GBP2_9FIRM|nr:glycosyltransferase [Thomasclavelia spiroformis]
MPLFSIAVPVYKAEKYLEKCINSILNQTFKDYEIILVDDGSPDQSGKICEEYSQKYSFIKTIHKKNGGLVSARKAGAKVMCGDYAICIDSDDWIESNYLEEFYKIINKYHPDVICSGLKRVSNNGCKEIPIFQREGYYSRKQIEKEIFPILIQGENGITFMPNIAGKCIKRELYTNSQLKVDDRIKISEDKSVTVPCIYKSSKIYIMKFCGYNYWKNSESMTDRKQVFPWSGPKLVARHLQNQIDTNIFDFQKQIDRFIVHSLFNVVVSQFNKSENSKSVVREIKKYLCDSYYRKAILNGKFKKYWPGILARYTLKYQMVWLAKIYYFKKYYL